MVRCILQAESNLHHSLSSRTWLLAPGFDTICRERAALINMESFAKSNIHQSKTPKMNLSISNLSLKFLINLIMIKS